MFFTFLCREYRAATDENRWSKAERAVDPQSQQTGVECGMDFFRNEPSHYFEEDNSERKCTEHLCSITWAQIKNNFALAARAEYFNDNKEIMIQTNIGKGFKVWGLSVNTDYSISDKILCRLEGKLYSASEDIFNNNSNAFVITTNIVFRL